MADLEVSTMMGIGGFVIGLLFGVLTHRTNFCTMGALNDAMSLNDLRRARAWLLAIAISIVGAQALHYSGTINLTKSLYLGPTVNWLGAIVGGLIFGFGMVISSGCPGRNLVRVGGGDLKALVVLLFIALFGYMAIHGLTSPIRSWFTSATAANLAAVSISDQRIGTIVADLFGFSKLHLHVLFAALISGGLLYYCFSDSEFRRSKKNIAAGVGLGLLVTAGWWVTGFLGNDDFEPARLASLSFVAPVGDSVQYLMIYSGATINFGIATVGGAIFGAFLSAKQKGVFALTTFFDKTDTVHHMLGGAMMGTGGVLALGCTIGQGMSGVSTLSLGSIIAIAAILAGGYQGIKYLERHVGL